MINNVCLNAPFLVVISDSSFFETILNLLKYNEVSFLTRTMGLISFKSSQLPHPPFLDQPVLCELPDLLKTWQ